ncbi:hypothetical protein K438DRAFT_1780749 [Mycena galopus ATCC 62051]|nr:hypothetical protein K438DRAFT_1780749 [Mycena galopus ATCC 62051]
MWGMCALERCAECVLASRGCASGALAPRRVVLEVHIATKCGAMLVSQPGTCTARSRLETDRTQGKDRGFVNRCQCLEQDGVFRFDVGMPAKEEHPKQCLRQSWILQGCVGGRTREAASELQKASQRVLRFRFAVACRGVAAVATSRAELRCLEERKWVKVDGRKPEDRDGGRPTSKAAASRKALDLQLKTVRFLSSGMRDPRCSSMISRFGFGSVRFKRKHTGSNARESHLSSREQRTDVIAAEAAFNVVHRLKPSPGTGASSSGACGCMWRDEGKDAHGTDRALAARRMFYAQLYARHCRTARRQFSGEKWERQCAAYAALDVHQRP